MDFNVGDKVKFIETTSLGHGQGRAGQVGVVEVVRDNLPAQGGPRVDIRFPDGGLERGISVNQIEHA